MSLHRSPPSTAPSPNINKLPECYGSDSALNISYLDNETNETSTNVTKRFKRKIGELGHKSDSSMTEIKEMFMTIQQQNQVLILKNDELQRSVNTLSDRHDAIITKVEALEKNNTIQAKRIELLENKIEALEKKSISTTIELRNIPKQNKECENRQAYIQYVSEVAKAVGVDTRLDNAQIRDAYRARSDAIIVDFVTTTTKDLLISGVKKFHKLNSQNKKPHLNTLHVGLPGPARPIYVAEMLSNKNKKLAFIARCLVKEHKIHSTWSSYGRIFVRRHEGQDPIKITDEEDFKQFGP